MSSLGRVKAVCTSSGKGGAKQSVPQARLVRGFGIEGDGHGGNWHRQLSLLASGGIAEMEAAGLDLEPGAFGENLVIDAPDLAGLRMGRRLRLGPDAVIQVTQKGKECHSPCEIFHTVGDCIMPREGFFARVLRSGSLHPGDELNADPELEQLRWAVITLSDRAASGGREDGSGPVVRRLLAEGIGGKELAGAVLPDDRELLAQKIRELADDAVADLVVTTGGTGLSPRDVTPEATRDVIDREVPGLAEEIRRAGGETTPRAVLSRGICGLRGTTLVVNLSGSPKAASEQLQAILPVLPHALEVASGIPLDCAR
jgi:molybdenum cofactor synthesis domain-containing protein